MKTSDGPGPHPRYWTALVWGAAAAAGGLATTVSLVQIDRIDPYEGINNLVSLWPYGVTFTAAWLLLGGVARQLTTHRTCGSAPGTAHRGSVGLILVVAAAARIATTLTSTPQLSDDLWRYIHDGRSMAAGINPYDQTPLDLGAGAGRDPILDQINHPEWVTIYQPTSQHVFGLLWWLHPHGIDPTAIYTFRLGFVALDLVVIGLLLYRLRFERRSPWWAILYAWHPLAISETAASGHQDVIGILMLLVALVAAQRRTVSWSRSIVAGVAFAACVAVKPVVLPLALPLAWGWRHQPRQIATSMASATVAGLVLYLPFVLSDGGIGRMWATTTTFMSTWHFNGSLHAATAGLWGSKTAGDITMTGLLMIVLLVCMWRRCDRWRTAIVFLFAGLLFSSTVYPWYLLWALALVPLRFDAAVWVFSLTIVWSYTVLGHVTVWHVPWWVLAAEYGPVYGAVVLKWWRWQSTCSRHNRLA